MAQYYQKTSLSLSQCWLKSLIHYSVTEGQDQFKRFYSRKYNQLHTSRICGLLRLTSIHITYYVRIKPLVYTIIIQWYLAQLPRRQAMSYCKAYIAGLEQERRNSSANALELHLSCNNPSICAFLPHLSEAHFWGYLSIVLINIELNLFMGVGVMLKVFQHIHSCIIPLLYF